MGPPFTSHEMGLWKGSHNPILMGTYNLQVGPHIGADSNSMEEIPGANLPEIPNDAMAVCGFRSPTLLW